MPSITAFDTIFLSYDEPNAERNYADLLGIAPWAKRVHGIKGFDAAHKAAAKLSDTGLFVTVDADNIVRPEFFDLDISDMDSFGCVSFSGQNSVNGLRYGNGGLKLWNKQYVLEMESHETSNDEAAVDFCWSAGYMHDKRVFSDVYCASTPEQAFRSGFREGVKLALDRGRRIEPREMTKKLHPSNLHNLRVWCTIGADAEFGDYAIYGARLGLSKMIDMTWDHTQVRDYDWFAKVARAEVAVARYILSQKSSGISAGNACVLGIEFPDIDAKASKFFKECLDASRT